MAGLHDLSETAGVLGFFLGAGSLWLGIANYRHTRSAPAREEQRRERTALRELLLCVKTDLLAACKTIADAGDLAPDPPASLQTLRDAIPRFMRIIDIPDNDKLHLVDVSVFTSESAWSSVARYVEDSKRNDPIFDTSSGRKRAAVEAQAKDTFQASIRVIDMTIDIIQSVNGT